MIAKKPTPSDTPAPAAAGEGKTPDGAAAPKRPHVLIALAAYNQVLYTNCFRAILSTQAALMQKGVRVSIREFSDPHITRARNEMTAAVLANPDYTHILMVDADTGFEAKTILRMLAFNKDVVGGAYPRRRYEFDRLKDMTVTDPSKAMQKMLSFILTPAYRDNNKLDIVKGFVKAKFVGTGCLLIKRQALEKMAKIMSHLKIRADKKVLKKEEPHMYSFFDAIPKGRDGAYLATDYAFCERWAYHCFGEIWADVAGRYTHNGPSMFEGSWMEAMKEQQRIK
jgi:hypothetical protein